MTYQKTLEAGLKEFEEKYEMKNFALYDKSVDMPATTNNIKNTLATFAEKLRESVIEEIDKEKAKWNGNGEYYVNVTEALDDLLAQLKNK